MPAGPIPNVIVQPSDRVDVALLVDRLRRDLLAAVAPDDVLEDLAWILRRRRAPASDGVDRARPDRVPALDELRELVDDEASLADLPLVALERELVAAQPDRATHAVAEGAQDPVVDGGQLGRDLVGDRKRFLQREKV